MCILKILYLNKFSLSVDRVVIVFFSIFVTRSWFQALEDFVWQSSDLLDRLEDMREDLNHNDFADDVPGAKKGNNNYTEFQF